MKEISKEVKAIIELGRELIAKAGNVESWTKEDEKQLKILKEMVGLFVKLQSISVEEVEVFEPKEDKKIIERFLKRKLKVIANKGD